MRINPYAMLPALTHTPIFPQVPVAAPIGAAIPAEPDAPPTVAPVDPYSLVPKLVLEDYDDPTMMRPSRPAMIGPALRDTWADRNAERNLIIASALGGLLTGDMKVAPQLLGAGLPALRHGSDYNLADAQREVDVQNAQIGQGYGDQIAAYEAYMEALNQRNELKAKRNTVKQREHDSLLDAAGRQAALAQKERNDKVRADYQLMRTKLDGVMGLLRNNPTPAAEEEAARIINKLTGWDLPTDLQQDLLQWKSEYQRVAEEGKNRRNTELVTGRKDLALTLQENLLNYYTDRDNLNRELERELTKIRDDTARFGITETSNRFRDQLQWDKDKFQDEYKVKKDSRKGATISEYLRRLDVEARGLAQLQAQRLSLHEEMRKYQTARMYPQYHKAVRDNADVQARMETHQKNIGKLNDAIKKVQSNPEARPAPTLDVPVGLGSAPPGLTARAVTVDIPRERPGNTLPDPATVNRNTRQTGNGALPASTSASQSQKRKTTTSTRTTTTTRGKGKLTPEQKKAWEDFQKVINGR